MRMVPFYPRRLIDLRTVSVEAAEGHQVGRGEDEVVVSVVCVLNMNIKLLDLLVTNCCEFPREIEYFWKNIINLD